MRIIILTFILVLNSCNMFSQKHISGTVINKHTKENIIGANIKAISREDGCFTNNFGFFSIYVEHLPDTFIVSYVGYKPEILIINNESENEIVELEKKQINLKATEVRAEQPFLIKPETGIVRISTKELKLLPSIGGETDALKAFQLMPGVQSANEGTSSLLVRGGSPDQTLILIDDVPIYYINHIGGFLSTIDVNTINDIKLIKGGFPAEYGNRLSGIMDIRLKNGNREKFKLSLNLGFISTKIFVEGPLKNKKTTYMFSLRRCNFDIGTRLYFNLRDMNLLAGYTFYDGYLKVNHIINNKNSISFTLYKGRDKIFMNNEYPDYDNKKMYIFNDYKRITWGNILSSLKYNHKFTKKIFGSTSLSFTKFKYDNLLNFKQIERSDNSIYKEGDIQYGSGIIDLSIRQDFDFYANNNLKIKAGAYFTQHNFNLGVYKSFLSGEDNEKAPNIAISSEIDIYEQNEIQFSDKLNMNLGIHFNSYFYKNEKYFSLQPRINISRQIGERNSVKFSYAVMNQNMHLLSNNGAGIPVDLWVPTTEKVKPQKSSQFNLGYYRVFNDSEYELSAELYFKNLSNQIDYSEGVNLFVGDSDWETKIVTDGLGYSKGMELLLRKKVGKLTGWIAYTLSYNYRKFDEINNGEWYPYKYDRRHVATLVGNYPIKDNIHLSWNFIFMTGNAITLPKGQYPTFIEERLYFELLAPSSTYIYDGRNSSRMPNYHRLDLSIIFKKELKKGNREWVVSIYNVYSRQNPYYLYFTKDANHIIHLNQMSLFPIIPSVSYNRNF